MDTSASQINNVHHELKKNGLSLNFHITTVHHITLCLDPWITAHSYISYLLVRKFLYSSKICRNLLNLALTQMPFFVFKVVFSLAILWVWLISTKMNTCVCHTATNKAKKQKAVLQHAMWRHVDNIFKHFFSVFRFQHARDQRCSWGRGVKYIAVN